MSMTTKDSTVRPEGFEPTTLGFEGRSGRLPASYAADRAFRLSPVFEGLDEALLPSRSPSSEIGSTDLAQIRPTVAVSR